MTKKKKPSYRVRNWADYNKSLVKRGSLTVWVSEEALKEWTNGVAAETERRFDSIAAGSDVRLQ